MVQSLNCHGEEPTSFGKIRRINLKPIARHKLALVDSFVPLTRSSEAGKGGEMRTTTRKSYVGPGDPGPVFFCPRSNKMGKSNLYMPFMVSP